MKDSDVNGAIAVSHIGVTIRYAISIGLVTILTVAVAVGHYTAIDKQKTSAMVINLSGRQRMLSQRAALFSLRLINSTGLQEKEDIRRELFAIADRMGKSHNGFLRGDKELGLSGNLSAESLAIFLESPVNLDAQMKSYVEMIRKIATSPENPLDGGGIHLAAQDELVASLDLLVHQFENENTLKVFNLQKMELAFQGSILLTLALTSLFIFRPAVKRLGVDARKVLDSRRRLAGVLDAVGEAIIVANMKGVIVQANREALRVWGYAPEELIGSDLRILMPPEYREAHQRGLERHVSTDVSHIIGRRLDMQGQRKDKSVFPLELFITETKVGEGSLFIAAARDVTEKKRAEEERARLVTAITQAAESIIITDVRGNIQYVNPAFEKITGYAREEVVGHNPNVLKSGRQDDAFYKDLWDTISKGRTWNGKFINKKKSGDLFEEEASITPVRSPSGEIISYIAMKRDITQETTIERQMRKTQKLEAIGSLAGGIAHDFNNLLTPIIGYTEMAIAELRDRYEVVESLQEVLKASGRAKDIVKQILAFGCENSGDRSPVMIHQAVKETLKLARVSIPSTVEIVEELDTSSGSVLADLAQISQVVMNLCINAAYAMREKGGRMTVSVMMFIVDTDSRWDHLGLTPGKYVRITVSDTGAGMDEKTLERIFEPFFTTKPPGEGTGLGLSVIHGIVKSHGGDVSVYSSLGNGSTFNVYLPRTEQAVMEKEEQDNPLPGGTGSILLVDDEMSILSMSGKLLKQLGYKVTAMNLPMEAVELFRKSPDSFDAIVTDQTMPKMTGVELAAEIIKIRPGTPVALCTGFSDSLTKDKAREMGISEFVMKPFGTRELAEAMSRLTGAVSKEALTADLLPP
jgi:PAS domain S-box-containing protein